MPLEEELLDKLHSDSILSSLHENEYSGKFNQKTLWQKFEDHVWYDAHKYFEELAYNGGKYDVCFIKAVRVVIFISLLGMWGVLYYNVVIYSGKGFLHLLSLVTFFTQWGMFFTTF